MNNMAFNPIETGKRIQLERNAAGLSQDQLAEKIGVSSRQTVAKWEAGKGSLSVRNLHDLCEIFNCDTGFLVGEYDCRTWVAAKLQDDLGLLETTSNTMREWRNPQMPEKSKSLLHANIDLLNEIIPRLLPTVAHDYLNLQIQRDSFANPPPRTSHDVSELISDVTWFAERHPDHPILSGPSAGIHHYAYEIARAIEIILRGVED